MNETPEIEIYVCHDCLFKFRSDVAMSNHEDRTGHSMDCERSGQATEEAIARSKCVDGGADSTMCSKEG